MSREGCYGARTSGRGPWGSARTSGRRTRGPEWTRRGGARRPRPSVHSCHPGERSMTARGGRARAHLYESPSLTASIPVKEWVRGLPINARIGARCGPGRPSTTPTGTPSSRPPRPGRFPLPKRPRSAVVWRSSSGEGRTPARRRARPGTRARVLDHASPAPRASTGTSRAGLLTEGGQPRVGPQT